VLFSGWCGAATMLFPYKERGCIAIKDGYTKTQRTHRLVGDERDGGVLALFEHWVVTHDQTPDPEHEEAVKLALAKYKTFAV
jgi:hypothetical protein